MKNTMTNKKLLNISIITVMWLLYFFIYKNAILSSDDFMYLQGTTNGFIGSINYFADHYFNWSGRLAHLFDIWFLMTNGWLWRVFTPLILSLLPFLCFYFAKLRLPKNKVDYTIISFIYLLMTTFSDLYTVQMLYWHTACITYLYFPFFMMLFLLPFRKLLGDVVINDKFKYYLIMPLSSFILGFSQEVVGAITFAFITFTIIFLKINNKKIPKFTYISLIFSVIGFLLLLKAPGNSIRLEYYGWWSDGGIVNQIKHGIGYFFMNQYVVQYIIISTFMICLIIRAYMINKKTFFISIPLIMTLFILFVLHFFESHLPWDIITVWKYSIGYFDLSIRQIVLPTLLYGTTTICIILLSIFISYNEKNVFVFILTAAVICSNLTTLASPVGTSYISFPGIILTFSLIIYLFPKINNKIYLYIILISMAFVINNIYKESEKMHINHVEEQLRKESIAIQLVENQNPIKLESFSNRVWEGDFVSPYFRWYYNIPDYIEVIVE